MAKESKFRHSLAKIEQLKDYWQGTKEAARRFKLSGPNKTIDDILVSSQVKNYSLIRVNFNITVDLKGGRSKTFFNMSMDLEPGLSKQDTIRRILDKTVNSMREWNYQLRQGRGTTAGIRAEINISNLEGI